MKSLVLLLAFSCSLFGQLGRVGAPTESSPLARDPTAVAAGEKNFRQLCTGCHGRSGEGGQGEGKGPNLVNSWEVRRASDKDLFGYIHNGVSGTAMPAFGLPDQSIRELAAFVRSLNAPANSVPVEGDAVTGQTVFTGKGGCGSCHMIRGSGGFLGPDLTNMGTKRRLAEIREAIVNPAKLSTDGFDAVVLKETTGHALKGVLKKESNWSLTVLDEKGQLHLLRGTEMKNVIKRQQWMPTNYAQLLSETDIQDLLAYLSKQ